MSDSKKQICTIPPEPAPPPPGNFFSKCPKILFSQIHVQGTWNFVFSSNPCTWVHEILFLLQFHVPRIHESEKTKSWDILKKKLAGGGGAGLGGMVQFFLKLADRMHSMRTNRASKNPD